MTKAYTVPQRGERGNTLLDHEQLGGDALVLRHEAIDRGIIQPVVRIDDVDIAAGSHNPPKSRLPAGDATLRVVLDVVDEGNERCELRLADDPEQFRVQRTFG